MPGFWGCKWCRGKGCISCDAEADRAYKKAYPDGPKPIAVFHKDNPEEMKALETFLSEGFGIGPDDVDIIKTMMDRKPDDGSAAIEKGD